MTGYQQCVNYYICNHQYYIKYSIHFKKQKAVEKLFSPRTARMNSRFFNSFKLKV